MLYKIAEHRAKAGGDQIRGETKENGALGSGVWTAPVDHPIDDSGCIGDCSGLKAGARHLSDEFRECGDFCRGVVAEFYARDLDRFRRYRSRGFEDGICRKDGS